LVASPFCVGLLKMLLTQMESFASWWLLAWTQLIFLLQGVWQLYKDICFYSLDSIFFLLLDYK
jgi:hypothetical protein